MAYLLDTNIVIAAMRGVPEVRLRLESTPLSQITLSVIVLGELEVGAEKSQHPARNRSRIEELKKNIPLVTLSEKTHLRTNPGNTRKTGLQDWRQ